MKRVFKWIGILFVLLVLAIFAIPFFVNVNDFRPTLESRLSDALGREVKLGNLKLQLLAGEVTADDLSVSEDPDFGKPAFLKASSLHVGVELWPFLLSRKLIVTDLTIDQPEIALVQSKNGDWNFSSLGGKSKAAPAPPGSAPKMPLDLSVKLIRINNGKLRLARTVGHWKPLILEQVQIEVRDFSSASPFQFSLATSVNGGGAIKLDGTAGPINPTDSAMTPVKVNLNVSQLNLAGSGMNDFAPDIAGLVTFQGSGDSDGTLMHFTGKLRADRLKIAKQGTPAMRPLELDLTAQHNLRKHTGVVRQGDIHIGGALAHLTGTYAEQGEAMVLDMKLSGPRMPVQELESMLPSLGVVLPAGASLQGGTATTNLVMQGPADRLVTTGSLALTNTRLTGFDLPQKLATVEKWAGIKASPDTDIQNASLNVRVSPEGSDAQDISLVVPAIGELSGAGTVSPANQLAFKMSAIVHTSGLLSVVGNKPIPFTVDGTCANPVFHPDMKAVAREEVKSVEQDVGKAAGGLLRGILGGKKP
jgi:AsmA protein